MKNVSRRASELSTMAPQRAWTRPAVLRMSAGSAENGGVTATDVGVSQS
ncbi:MAG TPA: hypothetical protein VGB62_09615 [Allosphingosinicella sp.]|jgi:hypothetical protein